MKRSSAFLWAVALFVGTHAASTYAVDAAPAINQNSDIGKQLLDWVAYGTTAPTFGAVTLLSTVSAVLNVLALVVMAGLAVMGGVTYVIQTANKGTPGGEVISSFWMPIRIVVATILLIPLTSGYSTLQYGVIKIAEKGNSHANYLVGKTVDYLYAYGIYRSPALEDGRSVILNWVSNEVCRQYINSYTGQDTISVNTTQTSSLAFYRKVLSYNYNEVKGTARENNPRIGYCGSVSVSIPMQNADAQQGSLMKGLFDRVSSDSQKPSSITQAMGKVLSDTQVKVAAIASKLLQDEAYLKQMQANGASQQGNFERAASQVTDNIAGGTDDLEAAITFYNSSVRAIVTGAVNAANGETTENNWANQVKQAGWPAYGTVYWIVNKRQSEINKLAAALTLTVTLPDIDEEWDKDPRFADVYSRVGAITKSYYSANRGNLDATFDLAAIASVAVSEGGWTSAVKKAVYDVFAAILKAGLFRNGEDDLIINVQYFGSAIGTFAEALFWNKMFGIALGKGIALQASDESNNVANAGAGLGNVLKFATAPAGAAGKSIAFFFDELSPFLNYLLILMIIVGFTLGIVLPSIPVVLWLMGVLSWLLFFVECLLVSPFWMAAHGTAEKEGWGSEHSRQGYMLMIGLYLNPILRVAGFSAIFLVLKPAGILTMILMDYISGVITSGFVLLFNNMGAMVLLSIFLYTALVRIFSLPAELFEKGLRWVNGGQEVTGDSRSEEQARHNVTVFAGEGKTAASMANKSRPGSFPTTPKSEGDPKKS